jgi:hypothetical protein
MPQPTRRKQGARLAYRAETRYEVTGDVGAHFLSLFENFGSATKALFHKGIFKNWADPHVPWKIRAFHAANARGRVVKIAAILRDSIYRRASANKKFHRKLASRVDGGNWSVVHERLNACLGRVYAGAIETLKGKDAVPVAAFPNSDWYCAIWLLPTAALFEADLYAAGQCFDLHKNVAKSFLALETQKNKQDAAAELWVLPLLRWAKALGSENVYVVKYENAVKYYSEHRAALEEWAAIGPLGTKDRFNNTLVPPQLQVRYVHLFALMCDTSEKIAI